MIKLSTYLFTISMFMVYEILRLVVPPRTGLRGSGESESSLAKYHLEVNTIESWEFTGMFQHSPKAALTGLSSCAMKLGM